LPWNPTPQETRWETVGRPDKISHKATFSVLIVFTGELSGRDIDAASAVAAGDAELAAEAPTR
jgi:hypothetical protein